MLAIDDVKDLAVRFCTYPAADRQIMRVWSPPLGYAHEIGHLLISTSEDRAQLWYGLGEPGGVPDHELDAEAPAVELAASIVHAWIVVATDWFRRRRSNRADLRLSISPRDPLSDSAFAPEFFYEPDEWRRARDLLTARGLRARDVQTKTALRRTIIRTLETT
jgi:hypothetical protein